MLKSIRIKNYQSHRDTRLDLCSSINGIIGKSLSGKTAIVRAINWLVTNRPTGFTYHSHFAKSKQTSVSATLASGEEIVHRKSKGKSKEYEYEIFYENGYSRGFQKVNRNVPDRVAELLNINEVNIQTQIEPHFLITSPPGQIAETINKATKIEKVDEWIKKINKWRNNLRSKKAVLRTDINELDNEIEKLKPLDKIEVDIRKLSIIDRKINKLEAKFVEISGTISGLDLARVSLKEAEESLRLKEKISKIEKIEKRMEEVSEEYHQLSKYSSKKNELLIAVKEHEKYEQRYIKALRKTNKCPTCYGKLNKDAIERVKDEIRLSE